MRKSIMWGFLVGFVGISLACGSAATPTPDVAATVDAAIAATSMAELAVQATVDAVVLATMTAVEAQPTPMPAGEYVTLSEEELAALIDQAVADALLASEDCATTTSAATADGTVTQDEVVVVEVQLVGVEEALAYADELIYAYYGLYGDMASETLYLLQAIEADLAVIAESSVQMAAALVEISSSLEQGVALATETLAQLEQAAQSVMAKATDVQAQSQAWQAALQSDLEARVAAVLAVPPSVVAANRIEAIQGSFDYLDTVRTALLDNKLSSDELAEIAQLGANAAAGLAAQGGPQLQALGGSVNAVTQQLARGQFSQARTSLGLFETALGERPSRSLRP